MTNWQLIDYCHLHCRQTTDQVTLQRATSDVMSTFRAHVPDFEATWVLIATWHNVSFFGYNGRGPFTPVCRYAVFKWEVEK